MAKRQARADRRTAPDADPQQQVEMTRAALMRGRGPGAPASETDGCKRDRPTLGSLPSPMERELVHLNTAAYRSPDASDLDETTVRSQRDRLRSLWGGAPEL